MNNVILRIKRRKSNEKIVYKKYNELQGGIKCY